MSLASNHAEMLDASGISAETIVERGYRTATTKGELAELGFPPSQRVVPTLVIPIHDVQGEVATYQHRPDAPRLNRDAKVIKYETRAGSRLVIDVPPAARLWLRDRERPLFVTEGSKKADAAVSAGLCAVALLGVWNWRDADGVLADWDYMGLKDRKVYLVFDSDVMEKQAVHQALVRVKAVLDHKHAAVRVIYLPCGDGGKKVGLDDFLAAGHSVDDLLAHATDTIRGQEIVEAEPAREFPATDLDSVIRTFREYMYMPDADSLLAVLGTYAANQLSGPPVWLLVVGPPSSGKTEMLMPLLTMPNVHLASVLTEGSLLSGTAAKEHAQGAKGGLLKEIGGFGYIVSKDFTSVLAMNRDPRGLVLAALREIYDGMWTRHVGTDGGKTLHWQGKIGFFGGCTAAIDAHHAVMAALGERFLLYRLPAVDDEAITIAALDQAGDEQHGVLGAAVAGLLQHIASPTMPFLSVEERGFLIDISKLAVRGRSSVDRESGASREIVNIPAAEAPPRLAQALQRLFGGLLAIGCDRPVAWRVVRHVALSSMPSIRLRAIDALAGNGWVRTSAASLRMQIPTVSAARTLEDLYVHRVMERRVEGDQEPGSGRAYEWRVATWAENAYSAVLPTSSQKSVRTEDGSIRQALECSESCDDRDTPGRTFGTRSLAECDGAHCGRLSYGAEARLQCGVHPPHPRGDLIGERDETSPSKRSSPHPDAE